MLFRSLALQSQYFPGASTSPYGPCLTLPGTVGSYYSATNLPGTNWSTSGFTLEAWINYASFANANNFVTAASCSGTMGVWSPTSAFVDWAIARRTHVPTPRKPGLNRAELDHSMRRHEMSRISLNIARASRRCRSNLRNDSHLSVSRK